MNKSDSHFRWLIVAAAVAVLGVSCRSPNAADAGADALIRAGLAAVSGSAICDVTGLPKRVVHAKTGIEMVLIPAGEFTMGSSANEVGRSKDEEPHLRLIQRPFYMAVTEVTQAQWQRVMNGHPSRFRGDDLPVERVSWDDCQKFVKKVGDGMRLPSEAEWEYACRADGSSAFSFGVYITPQQVNYDGDHPYNGAAKGLDRGQPVPVGSLPANQWGLHEMHGNVWEWCQDVYAAYPDRGTEAPNSDSGRLRVFRGGSWIDYSDYCRAACRGCYDPGGTFYYIGFRVVLAPVLVQ
jgi:formylglycine-generating enzyme required for sulfatase activity